MKAHMVLANGASIPALGLGTWQLMGDNCTAAVRHALEAGYRHIDTAAIYENEISVGAGLRLSGVPREEIFVTTKIWRTEVAPENLIKAAEASLKRLELSHVDLLLIHWPVSEVPLAGTMKALGEAKRKGLTRHIGISNFTAPLVEQAASLADEPLVTNQCEYHPRLSQEKVREACFKHGLSFTSYSPLGRGDLLKDPVVVAIAEEIQRSPAQVLLRWHVQQKQTIVIPKASSREKIVENLHIFDFKLTDDQMKKISALAKPNGRLISPDFAPQWDK